MLRPGRALELVHDKTVFGTSGYKVREGGNKLLWVTIGDNTYTSWTQMTDQGALLTTRHSWNAFLEPRPDRALETVHDKAVFGTSGYKVREVGIPPI